VRANFERLRTEEDRVVAGEIIPPVGPAGVIETEDEMVAPISAQLTAANEAWEREQPTSDDS